jgi:Holliday junction resolvase RusA-like endonuclease
MRVARVSDHALDFFVSALPAVKGNSRKVLFLGGRLTVQQTDKARAAERSLVALLMSHPARPPSPRDGPLRLDVEIRLPVPGSWSAAKRRRALEGELRPDRRPDRGNFLKLAEDALERAGFLVDDARIVEGDVSKVYAETPGWRFVLDEAGSER